ncbi:MAG: Ser-Thr-rich GPI-anchored membrane family protein [candidate division KSB1 bacterium]|nr:Ser-Thr-rich GPI-anchored membrane family protein [candidate division KSB1 bacterium]
MGSVTLGSLNDLWLDFMKTADNPADQQQVLEFCGFRVTEQAAHTNGLAPAHVNSIYLLHQDRTGVTANEIYQELLLYGMVTRRGDALGKAEFIDLLQALCTAAQQHPAAPHSLLYQYLLLDENGDMSKSPQSIVASTSFTPLQSVMLLSAFSILAHSPVTDYRPFARSLQAALSENWMSVPVDAGIDQGEFSDAVTDPAPGLAALRLGLEIGSGLSAPASGLNAQYLPFTASGALNEGTALGNLAAAFLYKIQTGRLGQMLSANEQQDLYLNQTGEFTSETGALSIMHPASGDVWAMGDTLEVTWNTGMLGGTVRLDLYKGAEPLENIVASTGNDGYFGDYVLPLNLQTGNDYRVYIRHREQPGYFDFGDRFVIQPQSDLLSITEPNRSTVWVQGQSRAPIRWDSRFAAGNVSILLIRGSNFKTIAANTPNDGEYSEFTVPVSQPPAEDYRIQIQRLDDPAISDQSPLFEIRASEDTGFQVTQPDAYSRWMPGETVQIAWQSQGNPGETVRIALVSPENQILEIAAETVNDGQFSYTLPDDLKAGTGYRVRIASVRSEVYAYSSAFEILAADQGYIRVTRPSAESVWVPGSTVEFIKWSATEHSGSQVRIVLYCDASPVLTIAESAQNSGTFAFSVPAGLAAGENYRVSVQSLQNEIADTSPAFTVIPESSGFWQTFESDAGNWQPLLESATWQVENGVYQCTSHPLSAASVYDAGFSGSFTYQADIAFTSSSAGLVFFVNAEAQGYAFTVNRSSEFSLFYIHSDDKADTLMSKFRHPAVAIEPGNSLNLRIEYKASEELFSFYADEQWLFYAGDSRYTDGKFGVFSEWCLGEKYSLFDHVKLLIRP